MLTEGQTDIGAKLIGAFCDDANAPKTEYRECQIARFFVWVWNMGETQIAVAIASH
jgi:hypothetical protein